MTDDEGDDQGQYATGQVVGKFGDVSDSAWRTVAFQVKIKTGQAGKDIRNVGSVNGDNIVTPDEPEEVVTVYPSNQHEGGTSKHPGIIKG